MKIDRNIVNKAFLDYAQGYDSENNYIKLKIAHTFRVAEIIDLITNQMAISSDEKDLAWLIGMLHDVERFEQIREYNTLSDIKIINQSNYVNDILKRIVFYNPENLQAVDDISEKIEDYTKDRVRG